MPQNNHNLGFVPNMLPLTGSKQRSSINKKPLKPQTATGTLNSKDMGPTEMVQPRSLRQNPKSRKNLEVRIISLVMNLVLQVQVHPLESRSLSLSIERLSMMMDLLPK